MIKKYLGKLILSYLIVGLFLSCSKDRTDLDNFLNQVDKAFSSNERALLIKCSDVKCIVSFFISHPNDSAVISLFRKIPKRLIDTLDAIGVGNNRPVFLLMCYNYKENDKTISYKEILEKIKDYDKSEELASDQMALGKIERLTKIGETNFKRIHINDTICLTFPMEYNKSGYKALYRIPFENEKLCTLTCHILKKEFLPKNIQYRFDNDKFILTMKILELNPTLLYFGLEDIKGGDKFILDIFEYGREIK